MQNVFITGAGGFIGKHMVAYLLKKGVQVTALMMPNEPVPTSWNDNVTIVRGDVRKLIELRTEIGDFDTMFHFAAIVSDWGGKQDHIDITVKGTEQAIELALANQARFLVTTSVATFASNLGSGHLDETSACGTPSCAYEYVKHLQEATTVDAVNNRGLDAVIIRPANVYGVGGIWVSRFIEKLSAQQPALMGSGDWDAGLVHVHNLVDAMYLAASNREIASGEIFIVSDGQGVTWREYLDALSDTLALPKAKGIPNWLARILAPTLDSLGHMVGLKNPPVVTNLAYRLTGVESIYDNTKAKQLLGFSPDFTLSMAMDEIKQHYSK